MKKIFCTIVFLCVLSFSFAQIPNIKYCKVQHLDYTENYISLIEIVPNTSGYPSMQSTWKEEEYPDAGGYDDWSTVLSGELALGDSISFYAEYYVKDLKTPFWYYLFIDWNSDGDFMDFGETLGSIQPKESDNKSNWFHFRVPNNPDFLGYKVFRLRMSSVNLDTFNNSPACVISGAGETEDHLVLIKPATITGTYIGALNSFYAYQVGSVLEIRNNNAHEKLQVNLRSIDGKILRSQESSGEFSVDIVNIENGIYLLDLTSLTDAPKTQKVIVNKQ